MLVSLPVREFPILSLNNSSIANKQKFISIVWPYREILLHLHEPYVHFQREARKVRDILLPCRKVMDAEDKKK